MDKPLTNSRPSTPIMEVSYHSEDINSSILDTSQENDQTLVFLLTMLNNFWSFIVTAFFRTPMLSHYSNSVIISEESSLENGESPSSSKQSFSSFKPISTDTGKLENVTMYSHNDHLSQLDLEIDKIKTDQLYTLKLFHNDIVNLLNDMLDSKEFKIVDEQASDNLFSTLINNNCNKLKSIKNDEANDQLPNLKAQFDKFKLDLKSFKQKVQTQFQHQITKGIPKQDDINNHVKAINEKVKSNDVSQRRDKEYPIPEVPKYTQGIQRISKSNLMMGLKELSKAESKKFKGSEKNESKLNTMEDTDFISIDFNENLKLFNKNFHDFWEVFESLLK